MAVGGRLHARARRARGGRSQGAGRGGRPLPHRRHRAGAGARGHRAGAQAWRRAAHGVRRRRCRDGRGLEIQHRAALPGERHPLCRSAAGALQLQQRLRCLRNLPRLRARDRCRHGPRDPRCAQDAAQRGHQADADAGLEGLPGRPRQVRRRGRHSARHAVGAAHAEPARLGDRGHAQLEGQLEHAVVRRAALLRVSREQGLQDAHPRALVEVPQLHAVWRVRRRAAQARGAAVAPGVGG